MSFFEKLFGSFSDKELKRINPLKDKVLALEPEIHRQTMRLVFVTLPETSRIVKVLRFKMVRFLLSL